MGSFCRINVWYTEFDEVSNLALSSRAPIVGAFLDGQNIYKQNLPSKALLVMGNEGSGIQTALEEKISMKIKIPEFKDTNSAESLNVSVATAIFCSEFKRR